jgi:hypothetical protein
LWWEDNDVSVGRWVQFDTDLSFLVTRNLFLAWSSSPDPADLPNPLLLLHGSAHHVIGMTDERERRAAKAQARWSTPPREEGRLLGSTVPVLWMITDELEPFLQHIRNPGQRLAAHLPMRLWGRRHFEFMSDVLSELEAASGMVTAVHWLALPV